MKVHRPHENANKNHYFNAQEHKTKKKQKRFSMEEYILTEPKEERDFVVPIYEVVYRTDVEPV